eukprot:3098298-Amphidinium_carterae.1
MEYCPIFGSFSAHCGRRSGERTRSAKMMRMAKKTGNANVRKTSRTAQWIKESTKRRHGMRPNATAMYTGGNHFQSAATLPS